MLSRTLLAVALALITACGEAPPPRAAQAPAPAAQPIAAPFPHAESGLPADPAVVWGSLPNGARYAIMRSAQPQGRVSLRLRIASGSLLEEDAQQGLAHLLEHMAFNGSKHYAPGELIPALQRIGIGFGSALNAHTGFDETVYKVDLPDAKPETLDIGLTVLADQAGGLLLDTAEVERERGVVLSELRDGEGAAKRLRDRELALLMAGTRIPVRFPIGKAETVAAATADLLRDYYATWYRPERMVLAVAGDVDPAVVEPRVRAILGAATALAPVRDEPAIGTVAPGTVAEALHDAEADDTSVRLTGIRPRALPADGFAARREQFLRDLGEAVLSRRIRTIIERDPQAPLLSGGGYSYQWLGHYLAGAAAQAKPGRALEALRLVATEYRRMAEYGPTAAEIALEASGLRAQLDAAVAQAGARRNDQLAAALYDSVADRQTFQSPEQARELGLKLLAEATPAAIRDAVRGGWDGRTRTVATVVGKDDLGADGDRLVAETIASVLAAPVEAPVERANATWAYAVDADYRGAVPERQPDAEWTIGTANGIAVAAKRTDFQPGMVAVRVRLPTRTHPRAPGLSELYARTLGDRALAKHTAGELGEALAGTTVRFGGLGIDDSGFSASVSCAPKDLRRALEVVRAWIEDQAWRPESEARAKAAWLPQLAAEATDVEAATFRRFNQLVLGESWRFSADAAAAEAATLDATRAWAAPLIAAAPLSCTIVGDVAEDEAMRLAASVLGGGSRPAIAAAATPEAARAALPAQPAMPAGEHRLSIESSVAKGMVIVAWPTADQYDVGQARRLSLLGGVFAELLREEVREKLGDAYSPTAGAMSGDDWAGEGRLLAIIGCKVERVDAVRDACLAIAARLREGVDPAVLERVRTPNLKQIADRRRNNGWWLGILARAHEQPFRLQWQAQLAADIAAATPDELTALARTYLQPEKALIVIGTSPGAK